MPAEPSDSLAIQFVEKVKNGLLNLNMHETEELKNSAEIFLKTRENDPELAAYAYISYQEKVRRNELYTDPSSSGEFMNLASQCKVQPMLTKINNTPALYIDPEFINSEIMTIEEIIPLIALFVKAAIFKLQLHDGKPVSIVFDFTEIGLTSISRDYFVEILCFLIECAPIVIEQIYFVNVSFLLKGIMKLLINFNENKEVFEDYILFIDEYEFISMAEQKRLVPSSLGGSSNINDDAIRQWNSDVIKYATKQFNSKGSFKSQFGSSKGPLDLSSLSSNKVSIPHTGLTGQITTRPESNDYNKLINKIIEIKNTTGFENHFKSLENPQLDHKTSSFLEFKNRHKDTPCFEESRVILKNGSNDYIHANYVPGVEGDDHEYILTQAPMESTVEDFWRMTWEQDSPLIVMLTPFYGKNGEEKCYKYFPMGENNITTLGPFKIMCSEEIRKEFYTLRTFNLFNDEYPSISKTVYHLARANESTNVLLELHSIDDLFEKNRLSGPKIIHDSSGTRQAAILVCVGLIRSLIRMKRDFDIDSIILDVRRKRAKSIRIAYEYQFIIITVLTYLKMKGLISPPNFDRLRTYGII